MTIGVLLLALFVALAKVGKVKTSNGIIELVDLPKDGAETDGKKLRESPPGLPGETADKGLAPDRSVENPTTAFVMERKMLTASAPSPAKEPSPSLSGGKAEFQLLFNGTDLAGWKVHPSQHADWRVEDGILLGSSPTAGMLYTERSDYSDFHLRLEARINDSGDSGVFFRSLFGPSLVRQSPAWPDGYEVELNRPELGFLEAWPGGRLSRTLNVAPVNNEWFPIEVIAKGDHFIISISGITTVDFTDPKRRFTSGHIALQKRGRTEVAFRNIQINELNGKPTVPPTRLVHVDEYNKGAPAEAAAAPSVKLVESKPAGPAKPKSPERHNPPRLILKPIGMTFNLIPAGEFMMGSPDDDKDAAPHEKPRHRVRISPFYLGVTEVTQGQYKAVMGDNPSHFSMTGEGADKVGGRSTEQFPVERVSWDDAVEFCDRLSEKEGRVPFYRKAGRKQERTDNGLGYRLPTEAEWEYACRAGTPMRYCFGNGGTALRAHAWFHVNAGGMTHPVGEKLPNALGLHDMHGNVSEWCSDWFADAYDLRAVASSPLGPRAGSHRVIRGGAMHQNAPQLRSGARFHDAPGQRRNYRGFRVAVGVSDH